MQKGTDHMLKNNFIKSLLEFNTPKKSQFNIVLDNLKYLLLKISNPNIEYDLEGIKEAISITLCYKGNFLFIDLTDSDLNIRFSYSEFYIFINEIDMEELKLLLFDFFEGKYIIKSFVNKDLIVKQELIFTNQYLKKYNQVDIYSNKNSNTIFEREKDIIGLETLFNNNQNFQKNKTHRNCGGF